MKRSEREWYARRGMHVEQGPYGPEIVHNNNNGRSLTYGERIALRHEKTLGRPLTEQGKAAWLPIRLGGKRDLGFVEIAQHEHIQVLHALMVFPQFRGRGYATTVLDDLKSGPPLLIQCSPFEAFLQEAVAGHYLPASSWSDHDSGIFMKDQPEHQKRLEAKYESIGFNRCHVAGLDPDITWFTNLDRNLNGFLSLLDSS